jgi:hypothetical protein
MSTKKPWSEQTRLEKAAGAMAGMLILFVGMIVGVALFDLFTWLWRLQ